MIRFFIDKKHSVEWHISEFEKNAEMFLYRIYTGKVL